MLLERLLLVTLLNLFPARARPTEGGKRAGPDVFTMRVPAVVSSVIQIFTGPRSVLLAVKYTRPDAVTSTAFNSSRQQVEIPFVIR